MPISTNIYEKMSGGEKLCDKYVHKTPISSSHQVVYTLDGHYSVEPWLSIIQ